MKNSVIFTSTVSAGFALMLMIGDACAVSQSRLFSINAAGACKPMLPGPGANIRMRPMAVQNEGNASAFVTCSYHAEEIASDALDVPPWPLRVTVYAAANDGKAHTLTCSGSAGGVYWKWPVIPKMVNLNASGAQAKMEWVGSEFWDKDFFPNGGLSISCDLTPGVGINDGYVTFIDELGS